MLENNSQTAQRKPKYCPMLKQECIGENCAWSSVVTIRKDRFLVCAIKTIAEKLGNMAHNINVRNC